MGALDKVFDLYGIKASSLAEARLVIEDMLGVVLIARESEYQGGNYFSIFDPLNREKESIKLVSNFIQFLDDYHEPAFLGFPFLLYIDYTLRSDMIRDILSRSDAIVQLRHETMRNTN